MTNLAPGQTIAKVYIYTIKPYKSKTSHEVLLNTINKLIHNTKITYIVLLNTLNKILYNIKLPHQIVPKILNKIYNIKLYKQPYKLLINTINDILYNKTNKKQNKNTKITTQTHPTYFTKLKRIRPIGLAKKTNEIKPHHQLKPLITPNNTTKRQKNIITKTHKTYKANKISNTNINKTPTLGIPHNNNHTKKPKQTNKLIYPQTKPHHPYKHKIQIHNKLTRPHHTMTNLNSHIQIPISIKNYCSP